MKQQFIKTILKKARAILDKSYIKWKVRDYKGGHCALGAVQEATGTIDGGEAWNLVNEAAKELHPKLRGKVKPRPNYGQDSFNDVPAIYVNNHLGKGPILAVFDAAIKRAKGKMTVL